MFSSLITPEEISRSDFDYLALGHVHVFDTMEHNGTRAAYPGSPNRDQGTREMTAAHIRFDPASGVMLSKILLE
ncbi:MAG: hypothetical protein HUJ31_02325 [Pseudomonadales bacterium]|nr:hypothetical protein [Pseudomonadales bacterium]